MYKAKDILKKTDLFLWRLELCRLILVLTRFVAKKNISPGVRNLGPRGANRGLKGEVAPSLLYSKYAPPPSLCFLKARRQFALY
jgi:hypothetical protein